MSRYTDKSDSICGDCAGIDMTTITEEDVRAQAKVWIDSGETVTEEDIIDAIRGLHEYQEQ